MSENDWKEKFNDLIYAKLSEFGVKEGKPISMEKRVSVEKMLLAAFPRNLTSNRLRSIWNGEVYAVLREVGIITQLNKRTSACFNSYWLSPRDVRF
jgi:hypothetical protein